MEHIEYMKKYTHTLNSSLKLWLSTSSHLITHPIGKTCDGSIPLINAAFLKISIASPFLPFIINQRGLSGIYFTLVNRLIKQGIEHTTTNNLHELKISRVRNATIGTRMDPAVQ